MSASSPTARAIPIPPVSARVWTTLRCLAGLVRDPSSIEKTFLLQKTINLPAMVRLLERVKSDPEGQEILREQPRIDTGTVDYDALRRLPDGTLGREYVRFLDDNGITPRSFRSAPRSMIQTSPTSCGVSGRRTILALAPRNQPPDTRGEVLVQAFTYPQTKAPSTLLLILAATLRWGPLGRTTHARSSVSTAEARRRGFS